MIQEIGYFRDNHRIMKERHHKACLFNREVIPLEIQFSESGELRAGFDCHSMYQGYEGVLHGGIISALIDSIMTQCVFSHGYAGYTARLNIQFKKPVKTGVELQAAAQVIENRLDKVLKLVATASQEGIECVKADASFWIFDYL